MKLYEYSIEHNHQKKKTKPDILVQQKKKKKQSAYYNLSPIVIPRNKKGQFKKL